MILNLLLIFQQFILVIFMQVFLFKKYVLVLILRQRRKTRSFEKPQPVDKRLQICYQNLQRGDCLTSQNFNAEVPKKRISTRSLLRRRQSTTKKCYAQYDQNHLHRLPLPPMEKSSESEEFGTTSSKRPKPVALAFGEMMCFISNKPDTNLCVAGVMHASKTAVVDKQHAKEKTKDKNNGNCFIQQAHSC